MLHGHDDAIWGLCVHSASGLLASCSADTTVKLWDAQLTEPLVRTIHPEQGGYLRACVCEMAFQV